jgi:hypothetical protein
MNKFDGFSGNIASMPSDVFAPDIRWAANHRIMIVGVGIKSEMAMFFLMG